MRRYTHVIYVHIYIFKIVFIFYRVKEPQNDHQEETIRDGAFNT